MHERRLDSVEAGLEGLRGELGELWAALRVERRERLDHRHRESMRRIDVLTREMRRPVRVQSAPVEHDGSVTEPSRDRRGRGASRLSRRAGIGLVASKDREQRRGESVSDRHNETLAGLMESLERRDKALQEQMAAFGRRSDALVDSTIGLRHTAEKWDRTVDALVGAIADLAVEVRALNGRKP